MFGVVQRVQVDICAKKYLLRQLLCALRVPQMGVSHREDHIEVLSDNRIELRLLLAGSINELHVSVRVKLMLHCVGATPRSHIRRSCNIHGEKEDRWQAADLHGGEKLSIY